MQSFPGYVSVSLALAPQRVKILNEAALVHEVGERVPSAWKAFLLVTNRIEGGHLGGRPRLLTAAPSSCRETARELTGCLLSSMSPHFHRSLLPYD